MPFQQALQEMENAYSGYDDVQLLQDFCRRSERGIIR
jgi:acyl-[acyl carrier protein]--UDP-N-acetylglucosamine O-acyltransferase